MTVRLFSISRSVIENAPYKAADMGILQLPVPFTISSSDRLTNGRTWLLGLRSQFDITADKNLVLSSVKHDPRLEREYPLYQKALLQCRSVGSSANAPVFLVELLPNKFVKEGGMEQFNGIEIFKPFSYIPQLAHISDISHLPFIPGTNDVIVPHTDNTHYMIAMRWWDMRERVTLVFAYKLGKPENSVNKVGEVNQKRTILYQIGFNEITGKDDCQEQGDISHLGAYVPGRADLFKPFDTMITNDVYHCDHRTWDAHNPNVINVLAKFQSILNTQLTPITKAA